MNSIQSNQYAMTLVVSKVFAKYAETLNGIPAFQAVVSEFNATLSQLEENIKIQQGKITGTSEQKQKEEQEMIDETVRIAAGVYVFAIDNMNLALAEKVAISPSALQNMNQAKLLASCMGILELAAEHLDEMADFGIAEADLKSLEKEINDFKELAVAPRTEIVTRSQATEKIRILINDLLNLLKLKADKFILMFKQTQPAFYNEYKSARIIVDLGKHAKTSAEESAINE